jgi:transposase
VRLAVAFGLPDAPPPAESGLVDQVAVEVAARGVRRVPLTAVERLAAVRLMSSWGLPAETIRGRLGVTDRTVERLLARVRREQAVRLVLVWVFGRRVGLRAVTMSRLLALVRTEQRGPVGGAAAARVVVEVEAAVRLLAGGLSATQVGYRVGLSASAVERLAQRVDEGEATVTRLLARESVAPVGAGGAAVA